MRLTCTEVRRCPLWTRAPWRRRHLTRGAVCYTAGSSSDPPLPVSTPRVLEHTSMSHSEGGPPRREKTKNNEAKRNRRITKSYGFFLGGLYNDPQNPSRECRKLFLISLTRFPDIATPYFINLGISACMFSLTRFKSRVILYDYLMLMWEESSDVYFCLPVKFLALFSDYIIWEILHNLNIYSIIFLNNIL